MEQNDLQPKSNVLTSNWLVGVLLVVLLAVGAAFVGNVENSQAAINSNVQQQISTIQSQMSKQTAILILIATKDGIPPSEISNLTN